MLYGFLDILYRPIPLWKLIYSCKNGIHPDKKHRLKTNINISKTRKNRKRMIQLKINYKKKEKRNLSKIYFIHITVSVDK